VWVKRLHVFLCFFAAIAAGLRRVALKTQFAAAAAERQGLVEVLVNPRKTFKKVLEAKLRI